MKPQSTPSPLVSPTVVADAVGVSERTIRRMCARGAIRGAVRVGKVWRLPANAFDAASEAERSAPRSGGDTQTAA